MDDIRSKIDNYLNDDIDEEIEDGDLVDLDLVEKMLDLIIDINDEFLSEDQKIELSELIDELCMPIDEAVAAKKVKIKMSDRLARRRKYRKNKARLKMKAKKFRRTSKFKKWKKISKRKAKSGKTATGKRIRKFM